MQPHFIPGIALKLAPRELNKAIALQLTTFPLPSSAGGFAYTTDPATGEIRLASATFGPVYAERALTNGKGRFDFGLAFQPTSFDSFETAELTDGSIKFVLEHNNCCPAGTNNAPTVPTGEGPNPFNPEFERDLLQSQISLDIETNTAVFFRKLRHLRSFRCRRRNSHRHGAARRKRHVHNPAHRHGGQTRGPTASTGRGSRR